MSFHVHIKTADSGWILEKLAQEIACRAEHVSHGTQANSNADIQYYMNYSAYREPVSPIEIAWFTHLEPAKEARDKFFQIAHNMTHCICHAPRYADMLRADGVANVSVISPGVDLEELSPKVKIGVVGRTYHTGRKGEALVAELMDIKGIEWHFTGEGWPGPARHIPEGQMGRFYNEMDYILIPAYYEGGPMSLVEALACGVEVIASDVGWVNEFPHIPFETGDSASLRAVLNRLVAKRYELRKSVEHLTWERWAEAHIELFDRLAQQTLPSRGSKGAKHALNVGIVTHGTEGHNRGGPTSRIQNIRAEAQKSGQFIDFAGSVKELGFSSKRGVVHVFNSWPLQTAQRQLATARRDGHKTIFSPIALNLSYREYFQPAMLQILAQAKDSSELDGLISQMFKTTPPWDMSSTQLLIEGQKGHFEALHKMAKLSDHLIFLSDYERAFFEAVGVKTPNHSLIRNGVDSRVMAEGSPEPFRQAYDIQGDFILMVGRIETRKNQALVSYALRNLDLPIVAIGHVGDPEYFRLIKRWSGKNFRHIDRIDDRAMLASAYKAASCFILTSWAEGAPLAALEAGAAGTPLILSPMSGEREYFGDFASYIHPCDIDGLKGAVENIIANPENEAERKKRSDHICAHFDISLHAKKTLECYEHVKARYSKQDQTKEPPSIVLDSTHVGHKISNGKWNFSGVPAAEYSILRAIFQNYPNDKLSMVVWNSPHRKFVDATPKEGGFDLTRSGQYANIRKLNAQEKTAEYKYQQISMHMPISDRAAVLRQLPKTLSKWSFCKLPASLRNPLLNRIRKFRPGFDPYVGNDPQVKKLFQSFLGKAPVAPLMQIEQKTTRILTYDHKEPGTVMVMIGQPWISNDKMLDSLCSYVQENGLRLFAHIPDILYVTDPDSFTLATRNSYRKRLQKLLAVTDTALVISRQAERDVRGFIAQSKLPTKTERIVLGPNEQLFNETAQKPSFKTPKRFVMYVSSFNNRKRQSYLIDIWKDFRSKNPEFEDVRLVLIGEIQAGYDHFEDQDFVKDLKKHGVQIENNVSAAELVWLYQNCLFTLYPSRSEGWGMPPIESLYFGKICLVSDSVPSAEETDCPALVKIGVNDYYGWVGAITKYIKDQNLRESLEKQARQNITPTWEEAANAILKDANRTP